MKSTESNINSSVAIAYENIYNVLTQTGLAKLQNNFDCGDWYWQIVGQLIKILPSPKDISETDALTKNLRRQY
jgi:hypothetical protein